MEIRSGILVFVVNFLIVGEEISTRRILRDCAPTVMIILMVLFGRRQVIVYDPLCILEVVVINPPNRLS